VEETALNLRTLQVSEEASIDDKGRNSKVLHVERMLLPKAFSNVLQLRNWGKRPHSIALKHNKSLGKKSSTTSKSLDLKQRRTITYCGIGFWACHLYLGLESTYVLIFQVLIIL
jgi:hypothetical protein